MLNFGNFSVNTHIIIIFAWYTYLGNTSRLKTFHVGMTNVKVTRSLGNIDPDMAVTPSISGVSKCHKIMKVPKKEGCCS